MWSFQLNCYTQMYNRNYSKFKLKDLQIAFHKYIITWRNTPSESKLPESIQQKLCTNANEHKWSHLSENHKLYPCIRTKPFDIYRNKPPCFDIWIDHFDIIGHFCPHWQHPLSSITTRKTRPRRYCTQFLLTIAISE